MIESEYSSFYLQGREVKYNPSNAISLTKPRSFIKPQVVRPIQVFVDFGG